MSGFSLTPRRGFSAQSKKPVFSLSLWTFFISCRLARASGAEMGASGAAGVCAWRWVRIRCKKFRLEGLYCWSPVDPASCNDADLDGAAAGVAAPVVASLSSSGQFFMQPSRVACAHWLYSSDNPSSVWVRGSTTDDCREQRAFCYEGCLERGRVIVEHDAIKWSWKSSRT